MNSTAISPIQLAKWFQVIKQEGFYFRQLGVLVIATGFYLHLTRLFVGDTILIRYILTPLFDQLFAIPMALTGIAGILSWKQMEFRSKSHRAFLRFILIYIAASIPLHVATYFTHSTEFTRRFPVWLSAVYLPFFTAVIVAIVRLRYKESAY
jgi:uncharacterized membrane protein